MDLVTGRRCRPMGACCVGSIASAVECRYADVMVCMVSGNGVVIG